MKQILPIGAVVLLKDGIDPVMIVGYLPTGIDKKERHYMGVAYPVGLLSMEDLVSFNIEDIKEVKYEGYKDNLLFQSFIKKLNNKNAFDLK